MGYKVITNGHPRPVILASELTEDDLRRLGYTPDEGDTFVHYRDWIYPISDFSTTWGLSRNSEGSTTPADLQGWHGFLSDSYFTGIVLRYTEDNDFVVVGRFHTTDDLAVVAGLESRPVAVETPRDSVSVPVDDQQPSDEEEEEDEHLYVSSCPACGEFIDFCQGHGEIGDPWGASILEMHDNGDHSECHPRGCDEAEDGARHSE
jgi:hypothetical protein